MDAKFLNVIVKSNGLPDKVWADMYRPELHELVDAKVEVKMDDPQPWIPEVPEVKTTVCPVCQREFKNANGLRLHSKTHA